MTDQENISTSALNELKRLRLLAEEITVSLRSQREILKQRGINLPPGALESLETIDGDLKKLESHLGNDETELSQLRSLAETSAMINSSLDPDEVLLKAMDEVINLSGAERGYIILRNPNTSELEFRVARDTEQETVENIESQVSHSIIEDVLSTGEPLLADNAYKDPRMQANESIAALSLRSVLCVPLNYKNTLTGVVYVDNRLKAGIFTKRELNLLVAFANQVAVAIENARLYQHVQASLIEITEIRDLMDNVFSSIGSGVITTNAVDLITTFNRAAARILNSMAENVIGQPLQRVMPPIGTDFTTSLQAVREHNASQVIEAEMDVPERGRMALSLKLSPLKDAMQTTQGVAMVLDDLTEQREREEMLNIMRRYLPPALVENIHHIAGLALGGERREVTCIFADVRPLYSFPTDLRPQQIMEMLNVYLAVATDTIHAANGVIDKYMGTELMVLFNTQLNPQPEDHAYQAINAALNLRDTFVTLYKQLGINPNPHFYRIGIHSGVATLGNVGSLSRRDFTAIGDNINLCKRLEENATAGQIIVSEDMVHYLHKFCGGLPDDIRLEEREAIQVKGRQQLTKIYEVFRR